MRHDSGARTRESEQHQPHAEPPDVVAGVHPLWQGWLYQGGDDNGSSRVHQTIVQPEVDRRAQHSDEYKVKLRRSGLRAAEIDEGGQGQVDYAPPQQRYSPLPL